METEKNNLLVTALQVEAIQLLSEKIQREQGQRKSRELSLAITKLDEAIMWLNWDLKKQVESCSPKPVEE